MSYYDHYPSDRENDWPSDDEIIDAQERAELEDRDRHLNETRRRWNLDIEPVDPDDCPF